MKPAKERTQATFVRTVLLSRDADVPAKDDNDVKRFEFVLPGRAGS